MFFLFIIAHTINKNMYPHNFKISEAPQVAVSLLCTSYDQLEPLVCGVKIPLSLKIEIAKRAAIKSLLDRCQCDKCIQFAYEVHQLNLFI